MREGTPIRAGTIQGAARQLGLVGSGVCPPFVRDLYDVRSVSRKNSTKYVFLRSLTAKKKILHQIPHTTAVPECDTDCDDGRGNVLLVLLQGKPSKKPARYKKVAAMTRGLIVESSPRYILSPIAPYRMKMIRPRAKLVVVLRNPTDR